MACNSGCDCNKDCGSSCNDCDNTEFPCGCDVVVDPSTLDECCFIWVMCEDTCGNALPQKVSLRALKAYFTE